MRTATLAVTLAAGALCLALPAAANTYAGSDWTLEYNLNGQIELSDSFIDFASGDQTTPVTALDIAGGANFAISAPLPLDIDMYEVDWNANATLGDIGDRLLRVYGDEPGESPVVIDGAYLAWMNPVLADYDLEITLARISTTIIGKNGDRVYDLRDGKGFVLEGYAWAKPDTGREDGTLAASSKFFLTRPVPEPSTLAGLAIGLTTLLSLRARRRA